MSLAGFVRTRKHQLGRQASFGTAVPAVKVYPFKGVPDVNLNWTDPDVDVGSLDLVAAPFPVAPDLTMPLDCPALTYNVLAALLCAIFGGGETSSSAGSGGTGWEWDHDPASLEADDVDAFTYEFGNTDVSTDWYQLRDGILESLEISGPTGLGPLSASGTWRFGHVGSTGSTDFGESGTVPTPDLDLDTDEARVFLKDMGLYIASSTAGLAAGQVTDALHSFTLRISGDVDQKRFANGDQSFDIDAYGRATRMIELVLVLAKTSDTVGEGSESDAWMSKTATNRYLRCVFTSEEIADLNGASPDVPNSWQFTMPARYYTREDGDEGGNATITLTARAFYDADDLAKVFESILVNTQETL